MVSLLVFVYNCMLLVFLVPILLAILLSGKKNRSEFLYKISERLGCWNLLELDKNKKTVWIHCASLGEAKAVEPMIPHLKDFNIIVSVITKSARQYISKIKNVSYYALAPVDFYPFIASKLKKVKPDILILIETEFWPSMITCAHKTGTKIITVNGRISKGAFFYYKLTKFFWKPFLNLIDFISTRNEHDYERFVKILGQKNKEKVFVTGNIKYDRNWTGEAVSRQTISLTEQDLIFTAGSTREGEEKIIIPAYAELKKKFENLKLIIAPRHISRVKEVVNIVKKNNLSFGLFSQPDSTKNDVIIVDVFGKLQAIYSVSDIVFVGGSLVNKGGQNPIEPAAYSKPVLFGKYMFNFESESAALKNNGAFEISGKKNLIDTAEKLLNNKNFRNGIGIKAAYVVESQKGAVLKNIEIIKKAI